MTAGNQLVKCPTCGTQGTAGEFCMMGCGRLPAAPAAPDAGSAPDPERKIQEAVAAAGELEARLDKADTVWSGNRQAQARPAAAQVPPPSPRSAPQEQERRSAAPQPPATDLELEQDALCVFFEHVNGLMRFRVTACRRLEGIQLEMVNPLTGKKLESRRLSSLDAGMKRELLVPVPGQDAGAVVWYLKVQYEVDGRKRSLEGEATVASLRPQEAQKAAENLSVTINNNISNGNASDVTLSQHAAEDLAHLAQSTNPYEKLKDIVQGDQRAWTQKSLDRGGALDVLPPMPAGAATDRLVLELGGGRLHLRAGRTVTVGRSRSSCSIALRPKPGATPMEVESFLKISRRQCYFEPQGERVAIADGFREGLGGAQPSASGTYWNGKPLARTLVLEPGESGMLSLAGPGTDNEIVFKAKACKPCGPCALCTRTDRAWCGEGRHACLLLTLQGVQPIEAFVTLWGCFGLGEADPAFEGVTLFPERGGFAWRRGRRCGWLVPGTDMDTEFGLLRIRSEEK